MFNWVYNLLYGLTKVLLNIIGYIMEAVNKISGIDDITFNGEATDFISYLLKSDKVTFAFAIASLLGIILIFLFAVIQIIVNYSKSKQEETPVEVAKKAAKNLLILLFVPTVMIAFVLLTNAFVRALYQATMVGNTSLPQYMFAIFGEQAAKEYGNGIEIFTNGTVMYNSSNSTRWQYMDMSEFDFFYSYLIGGIVVYLLLTTAMMLVERAMSIVLLYIVAPFVVASSVLDDGAKFKSWRDQILLKFLTGHGAIIAINIYLMVCSLVMDPNMRFVENGSLNNFLKLLFVLGGAMAVKQVQAVIGNLIQSGAGDRAVADNERATKSLGRAITSPLRGARSILNFAKDRRQYGLGGTIANRMGIKTQRDYGGMSKAQQGIRQQKLADKARLNEKLATSIGDKVASAIKGDSGEQQDKYKTNNFDPVANSRPGGKTAGENMVNNAIAGSKDRAKDKDKK